MDKYDLQKEGLIRRVGGLQRHLDDPDNWLLDMLREEKPMTRSEYAMALDTYTANVWIIDGRDLERAIAFANHVPGFWETLIGRLIARSMCRDLHPLTVTAYAEREGITLSAASSRVRRGEVTSFPDPDENNPRKRTRVLP